MTDGFRPIKHGLNDLELVTGPNVYAWDPLAQRYVEPMSLAS